MNSLQWLALAGPTASGKTALALEIATRWPVEIISVDSALVYRGMDIGTAKPTPSEQALVPHHLIDIRDPSQAYSAAEFARDATALVHDIRRRGRLPLLVGGTMLYFKALFEGLDDMPAAQPALRAQIEQRASTLGWPALHAELAAVDPITAARLAPNDSQRIGRALEVYMSTGKALATFHQRQAQPQTERPPQIDGLAGELWSLEPTDRAWLHHRIEQRFDAMLKEGFVDEVRALRARSDLTADLPAMRCVGYRQVWEALDASAEKGETSLPATAWTEMRNRGIFATRQLAKRQLTWLRGMPWRHTLACDAPTFLASATAELDQRDIVLG
jgi:tRNA dimethylallyltransferase